MGLGLRFETSFDAILLASILGAVGRGIVLHGLRSAGSRTCEALFYLCFFFHIFFKVFLVLKIFSRS